MPEPGFKGAGVVVSRRNKVTRILQETAMQT